MLTPITPANPSITNDTSTNATMYLTWVTTTSGNLPLKITSTKLTFNPSTGELNSSNFRTNMGSQSVVLGVSAGGSLSSGSGNVVVGYQAGAAMPSGSTQNTILGGFAGASFTGNAGTFFGYAAGQNTTANGCTLVGWYAGQANSSGDITAIGDQALKVNTTGGQSVAVGRYALLANTSGAQQTGVGYGAFYQLAAGSNNSGFGYLTGYPITSGDKLTFLGHKSGYSSTTTGLSNSTAIGYNAQVTQSNSIILGATGSDKVQGGIGTTAPSAKWHVNCEQTNETGVLVKGAASRTSPLIQMQTSAGASLGNVGGVIFNSFTDTATTSTDGTENDLYSYTIAANTLTVNGDSLHQVETLKTAASATTGNFRIRKYFAGTLIFDTNTAGAISTFLFADDVFRIVTEIVRQSSTVVRVTVTITGEQATAGLVISKYVELTGLTLTSTNILKTTGVVDSGAAVGDLINKCSKVTLMPAA